MNKAEIDAKLSSLQNIENENCERIVKCLGISGIIGDLECARYILSEIENNMLR